MLPHCTDKETEALLGYICILSYPDRKTQNWDVCIILSGSALLPLPTTPCPPGSPSSSLAVFCWPSSLTSLPGGSWASVPIKGSSTCLTWFPELCLQLRCIIHAKSPSMSRTELLSSLRKRQPHPTSLLRPCYRSPVSPQTQHLLWSSPQPSSVDPLFKYISVQVTSVPLQLFLHSAQAFLLMLRPWPGQGVQWVGVWPPSPIIRVLCLLGCF